MSIDNYTYYINKKYLKYNDYSTLEMIPEYRYDEFNPNEYYIINIKNSYKFVESLNNEFEIYSKNYISNCDYTIKYKNNHIDIIITKSSYIQKIQIKKSLDLFKAINMKFTITSISFKNKNTPHKYKLSIPDIPCQFKNVETIYSDCDYIYDYKIYNSYPNLKYLILPNITEIILPDILNFVDTNLKFIYAPNVKLIKINESIIKSLKKEIIINECFNNICLYAPNYIQIQTTHDVIDKYFDFNKLNDEYKNIVSKYIKI